MPGPEMIDARAGDFSMQKSGKAKDCHYNCCPVRRDLGRSLSEDNLSVDKTEKTLTRSTARRGSADLSIVFRSLVLPSFFITC